MIDEGQYDRIEGWAFPGWSGQSTIYIGPVRDGEYLTEITVGHVYRGMVPVEVLIRRRQVEGFDGWDDPEEKP